MHCPIGEVGMPVAARVEWVARVVGMDEIDPPGDRLHPADDAVQVLAAGMRVTCVEHEADVVTADRVPQPRDCIQPPSHRVVAASSVFDEDRTAHLYPFDGLAPVVEADLRVILLEYVTGMDDQRPGTDLCGCIDVLLEQLEIGKA